MNSNHQRLSLIALPALLLALTGVAQISNAEESARPTLGEKVDRNVEEAVRPTMGERVDQAGVNMNDTAITAKVKGAFLVEKTLKVLDIHVTTTQGVVALSGDVDSQASIDRAKELAAAVKDVKAVTSTLAIKTKS